MFEKVNPSHPDKVADRIAGAMVDAAYRRQRSPRIACEVLIGHGRCLVICETSVGLSGEVGGIVSRIAGEGVETEYVEVPQDPRLAENQSGHMRCGDNGIFKGAPVTEEQRRLSAIARGIYARFPTDGKYVLDGDGLVVCQSCMPPGSLGGCFPRLDVIENPLGYWTGGIDVDSGATNRKLGSDMGDGITGGGLHGKDLSKADVSVNIYAHLEARRLGRPVEYSCAIGDEAVDGVPFMAIVEIAEGYIRSLGGFEALAKWGLI